MDKYIDCAYCKRRNCLVCGSAIRVFSVDGVWNWAKHTRTQKHRDAADEVMSRELDVLFGRKG